MQLPMRSIGDMGEPRRRISTLELRLQPRKTVHQTDKEMGGVAMEKTQKRRLGKSDLKVRAFPMSVLPRRCSASKPAVLLGDL